MWYWGFHGNGILDCVLFRAFLLLHRLVYLRIFNITSWISPSSLLVMDSILLYRHAISAFQLMTIDVSFLALMNKVAMKLCVYLFVQTCFHIVI